MSQHCRSPDLFAAAARRCGRCGLREPFCPNAIRDEMGLTGSKRLNGNCTGVICRVRSFPGSGASQRGFALYTVLSQVAKEYIHISQCTGIKITPSPPGARGLVLHRPASLQAPKIQARPKGFYSGPSSGIRNMSRGISRVTAGCSAWKGLVAKGGNVRNAMDYFRSATSVLQRYLF